MPMPKTPQLPFRMAGLTIVLLVAVIHFLSPDEARPESTWLQVIVGDAGTLVILAIFAAALWFTLDDVPPRRPGRRHIALLLLQVGCATLVTTDLFFLIAAEAALVLTRRQALWWMAAQVTGMFALSTLLYRFGRFEGITPLMERDPLLGFFMTVLGVLGWQFFAFGVGWFAAGEARGRREQARLNAELVAAQQTLAENSRIAERLHISRELHDTVGHHLVALNLQLALARHDPVSSAAPLDTASAVARDLLGEVRRVVGVLRQDHAIDLRQALQTMQASIPRPRIDLQLDDDLRINDPTIGMTLFRCLQEAVTNTLRHAEAETLHITLARTVDAAILTVRDDGCGAASIAPGHGLRGMRERVEERGGSMTIEATPGTGFNLSISLPLAQAAP